MEASQCCLGRCGARGHAHRRIWGWLVSMGPAAVRTASHLPASPRAPPLPLTVYGAYWRRRPLSRFCPDMLLTLRPAAFLCHERRTFLGVTVPSPPVVGISRPIALPPLLRDVPTATSPHCRTINAGPPSTPTHTLHTALSSSDHQSHPLAPSLTVVAARVALAALRRRAQSGSQWSRAELWVECREWHGELWLPS